MWLRTLGSGWGTLAPGALLAMLGFTGLSEEAWRGLVMLGMLLACLMIWHPRLRHFILLPSSVALIGGIVLAMNMVILRE